MSFGLQGLGLLILAAVYLLLRRYLEARENRGRTPSDEERLCAFTLVRNCSTLEAFRLAGEVWRVTDAKVREDFERYLRTGEIPAYLRDWLRRKVTAEDLDYHRMIRGGGEPPRSGSA